MLPFLLYAGAAAINIMAQNRADDAQAAGERRNAAFYREQEEMSKQELLRGLELFDNKTERIKGEQLTHAGSGGFAITAFTLDTLANESAKMAKERGFMKRQGEFKTRMFALRAQGANVEADSLTDSNTRNMRLVGGLLSAGSKVDFSGGATTPKYPNMDPNPDTPPVYDL
jgi:hypothetical protein